MAELSKEFKDEAWKEVNKSLEELEPLKDLHESIKSQIEKHNSVVLNYLAHLTKE